MALVIARIRCANEASALKITSLSNGEKLFMSVISAECTKVEYATERHSESPPPVGTKQTRAILRRGRGAEVLHHAYKWSSILQARKPRLTPDLFICGKFTARLTTTKCSSAGLLTARSSFAMQSALPWAKETLLNLRRFVLSLRLCPIIPPPMPLFHRSIGGKSAQASALGPLGCVCGRPRLRGIRYIFSALF
jgi:hypothetical protein